MSLTTHPQGPGAAAVPAATDAPATVEIPSWAAWAGLVAIVVTYFALLGAFPLAEPDEARYGEIPREMIESGDWITPRLNYVKYFEKPPLVYWLTAINFELFGMNELAARLWLGICAMIGVALAGALARAMYGPTTGMLAAALLAAMPLYFGLSQFLTLDLPLSTWMTVGLSSFWFAYQRPDGRRMWVLGLYAATALAVLTKGPVAAVLTGGIILVFLVLRGDWPALRWVASPLGIAVFLLVALPWHVAVGLRNPEFAHYFIVDQHLNRYLNPNEHQEAFWFYGPILLAGTLPWSAFLVLSPGTTMAFVRRLLSRRVGVGTLYLAVWCGIVFLFFSASGSKLGTYILPMLCPVAVLLARIFESVVRTARDSMLRRGFLFVLVLGLVVTIGGVLSLQVNDDPRVALVVARALPATFLLTAAAGISVLCLRRGARLASLGVLWVGTLALQLIAITSREVSGTFPDLGTAIRQHARPADLVVGFKHYVQGVTFYGRRRVIQVAGHGELEFGRAQGDTSAFFWPAREQLFDAWSSGRRIFLVINRNEYEWVRPFLHPAPREIESQGRKVLVVNFDPE